MMGQMMASPGKNQCTELVVESCEVLGPIISSTTRGQSVGGGGVGGVGGVGGGLGIVDNQLLASHAETPETPVSLAPTLFSSSSHTHETNPLPLEYPTSISIYIFIVSSSQVIRVI